MNSTETDSPSEVQQGPPVEAQAKTRLTTHRERKIHRHIREIARPRSQDKTVEDLNDEAKGSGSKEDFV